MKLICPELSLDASAGRLGRLREGLAAIGAQCAVLHEPDVIRWAVGCTSQHTWPAALVVTPDEAVAILFAGGEQPSIATRQVVMSGIRPDRAVSHHAELAKAAGPWLANLGRFGPVGIDVLGAPGWISASLDARAPRVDAAPLLAKLRRRKDTDEVAIIEHNVAVAEIAYRAAAETIRVGITELDVYRAMRDAAEGAVGTSVTFGGDFMAGPGGGEAGGPPSTRRLADGDSFVIDFFPNRGGYWADMCRTYPIGEPGARLAEAIRLTAATLDLVETIVRPGVSVAELDSALRARQSEWRAGAGDYFHLTGHGIGLRPHEAPWIVAESDEVFEPGDVLAVEPAVYSADLRGGVRIEDDYVVTEDGVRRLSRLPR